MSQEAEDVIKPGWQSVRTILEALILAALIWCGKTLITTGQQLAVMTSQMDSLSKQLSGVPELSTRVARLEIQVEQDKQDIKELRQLKGLR